MHPPILKPPEELRRLGMPESLIALSQQQYDEWANGPHVCGMRGFDVAEGHRCPGCERERKPTS